MFGNYNNWMTIRGIHTNRSAWQGYPNLPLVTVYGFWVNDPKTGGLGGNTYVTAQTFLSGYFQPITVVGDVFKNQYLVIIEPPQGISEPAYQSVEIGQNPAGFTQQEGVIIRSGQTMKTSSAVKDLANTIITEKARRFVTCVLQYDPSELAQLFAESHVNQKPIRSGSEWMIVFSHPSGVVFDVRLSAVTGEPMRFSVM